MASRHSSIRSFVWVACLLAGCSSAPEEKIFPVEGQVTVQGQPLATGTIVFKPDTTKGNTSRNEPRAKIEAGKFKLTTGDKPGAAPGWYQITIFAMKEPAAQTDQQPPEWLANQRYTDVKTSGLAVEVVEQPASGAYQFDLEP